MDVKKDYVFESIREDTLTIIDKRHLFDNRLRSNAARILSIMLSRGTGWKFCESELLSHLPVTRKTLVNAMKELEELGYIERIPKPKNQGYYYLVFPIPKEEFFKEVGTTEKEFYTVGNFTTYISNIEQDNTISTNDNVQGDIGGNFYDRSEKDQLRVRVINYLNEKTGKRFNPNTAQTKKLLGGRINNGYVWEDFKHVIDLKVAQWSGDSKMDKYLTPYTLFRPSNFERYLNEGTRIYEKEENPKYDYPEEYKDLYEF